MLLPSSEKAGNGAQLKSSAHGAELCPRGGWANTRRGESALVYKSGTHRRLGQEPTWVYLLGDNDVTVLISVTKKKKNAFVSSPWWSRFSFLWKCFWSNRHLKRFIAEMKTSRRWNKKMSAEVEYNCLQWSRPAAWWLPGFSGWRRGRGHEGDPNSSHHYGQSCWFPRGLWHCHPPHTY